MFTGLDVISMNIPRRPWKCPILGDDHARWHSPTHHSIEIEVFWIGLDEKNSYSTANRTAACEMRLYAVQVAENKKSGSNPYGIGTSFEFPATHFVSG